MQLSKKVKRFCWIFSAVLKSKSNFRHFETKEDGHGLCISKIPDCQRHV